MLALCYTAGMARDAVTYSDQVSKVGLCPCQCLEMKMVYKIRHLKEVQEVEELT
jgi:hypothetical protein